MGERRRQHTREFKLEAVRLLHESGRSKAQIARELGIHEFLRRFLQHVLPRGFQKVRHYGFLSPQSRTRFETVRWLALLHAGEPFVLGALLPRSATTEAPRPHCRACGADLVLVGFLRACGPARGSALFDTS